MDAFLKSHRPVADAAFHQSNKPERETTEAVGVAEDSTDVKLALLASLSQCDDTSLLLDALLAADGCVAKAAEQLNGTTEPHRSARKRSSAASNGYQSSLLAFGSSDSHGSRKRASTQRGKTLHLYSPEDVATHTPCSLLHNFLVPDVADTLLQELLGEAPTFSKDTFRLFDNVVTSPHTICFYADDWDEAKKLKTDYVYNGSYLADVRRTPEQMRKVSALVEEAVNKEISKRIESHYPGQTKLKYQSSDPWVPNTAFANCYDGGKESVGWHSDHLTYLGPRAVIGSVSLGVTREFRVRRVIARDSPSDAKDKAARKANELRADIEGQIAIHLPHNSLLVMHAEMQEEWKHSISPAQVIDPHPIAMNKRINITYRYYKPEFHPRFTPRCRCGIATVLRCVQKKEENRGRYMWMCYAGYTPGQDGCTFFQWAEFDDDGRPPWALDTQLAADSDHVSFTDPITTTDRLAPV